MIRVVPLTDLHEGAAWFGLLVLLTKASSVPNARPSTLSQLRRFLASTSSRMVHAARLAERAVRCRTRMQWAVNEAGDVDGTHVP